MCGCRATVEVSRLEHLEKVEKDKRCPERERHRKHVRLVEVEGRVLKCPVCQILLPSQEIIARPETLCGCTLDR